mgnify:FL=1
MALDYSREVTGSMGVSDLGRSITWYQDILGFELVYRVDDIGWCELSTGFDGFTIGLSQVEKVQQGGGATNVFGVKDIDVAKAFLDERGVRQDGDIQHVPGMVKLITFYDPDGNAMMLAQNLADPG